MASLIPVQRLESVDKWNESIHLLRNAGNAGDKEAQIIPDQGSENQSIKVASQRFGRNLKTSSTFSQKVLLFNTDTGDQEFLLGWRAGENLTPGIKHTLTEALPDNIFHRLSTE